MIVNDKTLEKLQKLINEEIVYRSGPALVTFFNNLGFNDTYGQGFPSRWRYTQDKLEKINGTPELDRCIKMVFSPINFINRFEELDKLIEEFNGFLMFDDWKIIRNGRDITFKKTSEAEWIKVASKPKEQEIAVNEEQFLKLNINYDLTKLDIDECIKPILNERLIELEKCLKFDLPLSAIFLCGSTLEGILLGTATHNPQLFNTATASPKNKEGKVKKFVDWKLGELIDVSTELNFLNTDVKKFSHVLRDFRNYIHPYEQLSNSFSPDINTAKICFQVLKTAIYQLSK